MGTVLKSDTCNMWTWAAQSSMLAMHMEGFVVPRHYHCSGSYFVSFVSSAQSKTNCVKQLIQTIYNFINQKGTNPPLCK